MSSPSEGGEGSRPQQRPDPAQPAGTDLLPDIRHIVVLMMENHSYDSYLGMLEGRGDGLALGPDGLSTAVNLRQDGAAVPLRHAPGPVQEPRSPAQSWNACHIQWNDGRCDGFVRSVEITRPKADATAPMRYWTGADLPFYNGLARTFPVADRWFGSCLGPTFPNRRFLIAGTAHGLIDDVPFGLVDYPPAGTIFDLLGRHGISWANYHNVAPAKVVLSRLLGRPGLIALRRLASVARWLPPVVEAVRGNKSFTADLYPLGLRDSRKHLRTTQQFFADADRGALPAFSIVDPDFASYSEENPQDIRRGESFAAEVINRVMHGPGWPHTLLIWLYDEHGGYYDHVPPPPAPPPDDVEGRSILNLPGWLRACLRPLFGTYIAGVEAEDAGPRGYDRYGFRVPAVIVSPYARPGYVCSETLDHTSVLKLVEQKWNLPPLTRRDAAAASPLGALDLESPPAFLNPPSLPAPSLAWGSW
ncbi:MAG TPA: alkaline phosphatase family protein [Streptosporangiaceae bacterium]|nr:alkaline phosphatase family protein [Streptosporangiaceae bacterium]